MKELWLTLPLTAGRGQGGDENMRRMLAMLEDSNQRSNMMMNLLINRLDRMEQNMSNQASVQQ